MVKTLLLFDCIDNLCYEEIVWRQLELAIFGALTLVGALFVFTEKIFIPLGEDKMKALKIIIAILLLLSVLPVSGCVFSQSFSQSTLEEEFEKLPLSSLTTYEKIVVPDAEAKLDSSTRSLALLLVCTFLFVLSAGIIVIVWRKKFYGAFVSGVLVLITYIWNTSLQNKIQRLASDSILRKCKSIVACTNTSTLELANLILFLPMVLLLIIGIIEIIFYFVKKRKNISL